MAGEVQTVNQSIAKARQAQKSFEERKKRVEDEKVKSEATEKRDKELKQKLKETKAISKATMVVTGGIAAVVAVQIGGLRGKLVAQIQEQVLNTLNKFSSGCPDTKELEKIIKTRNTLLNHLSSFENRVGKFSTIAKQLTAIIALLNLAIKVITSIPVPTAIIPPQSGGVGIPISVITKYSNTLVSLNKALDKLTGEAIAITGIISSINPVISNLKDRLNSIDTAIQQCSLGKPADLNQLLASTQPPTNTGSEGTPRDAQGNIDPNYIHTNPTTGKTYTLSIQQDADSPKIAPKRYAIATDKRGIVVLKGPSSFSSSTQVLLDEMKFKIDNQLI